MVAPFVVALLALPLLFLAGRMSAPNSQLAAPVEGPGFDTDPSPWPLPYAFRWELPGGPPEVPRPPFPFDHIQLQRTTCFGTCPAYTVTLWRDGRATYSGREYAPRTGEFQGQVEWARYGWLCYLLEALHFDQLKPDYSANVTDMPTTFVRAWREPDAKPIEVSDYGLAGPVALFGIERNIDAVANEITWTPAH